MATTKKAKADVTTEPPVTDHSGWGHDWRNPDATFDKDDHCPNAEMRRLADR